MDFYLKFNKGTIIRHQLPKSTLNRINFKGKWVFSHSRITIAKCGGAQYQRWSRGHKARGQDQVHKKKSEAKSSLSGDRPSRGQQGQECSTPRPRTKDTAASVLQKKNLQKSFFGDLQFIGVPRIFDWGRPKPQITCNDIIKNFQKRKFLWD